MGNSRDRARGVCHDVKYSDIPQDVVATGCAQSDDQSGEKLHVEQPHNPVQEGRDTARRKRVKATRVHQPPAPSPQGYNSPQPQPTTEQRGTTPYALPRCCPTGAGRRGRSTCHKLAE